jgi:hypothetical protein
VLYFVGLDVSLDETAICVIDEVGGIFKEGKAETDPDAIIAWLNGVDGTIERVGLEAGPLSPWLYEGLRAAGVPAICIETRRMKGATAAMAVKTDRNDARAIAQAIRVGWFTAVHVNVMFRNSQMAAGIPNRGARDGGSSGSARALLNPISCSGSCRGLLCVQAISA